MEPKLVRAGRPALPRIKATPGLALSGPKDPRSLLGSYEEDTKNPNTPSFRRNHTQATLDSFNDTAIPRYRHISQDTTPPFQTTLEPIHHTTHPFILTITDTITTLTPTQEPLPQSHHTLSQHHQTVNRPHTIL